MLSVFIASSKMLAMFFSVSPTNLSRMSAARVHPAYLLRLQDKGRAREEHRRFVDDLWLARELG